MRWLQHQVSTSISRLHRCNAHTALFLVKPLSSSCLIYCTDVNTVSAKRWTNEVKSFKWRKSKNGWRKREAAPVRGLGKLPFGRGPSAVVELTWSFICSQLCDSRQKSDHRCPAWLPVVHTHRHKSTHNLELKAVAHTRLIPALISQCKLFIYCWIFLFTSSESWTTYDITDRFPLRLGSLLCRSVQTWRFCCRPKDWRSTVVVCVKM